MQRLGSLGLAALFWGATAVAQTGAPVPLDPAARGAAYLAAMRWQGIQTGVTYFDPARPAPPLDPLHRVPPPPPPEPQRVGADAALGNRWVWMAVAALVLALLARLVWLNGAVNAARFRRPETGRVGRTAEAAAATRAEPLDLRRILDIADRQEALHALLAGALARAAEANDLRLHPSWTARDALRAVPAGWPWRGALGEVALAAEQAWFGDRPVSEADFARHVAAIRPVFAGTGP